MSEEKIKIRVEVAQRYFELNINKEYETYYREAEKKINEFFLRYAKRWNYTDHQDLLSKILIDVVVQWIEAEERLNEYDEELIPMMEKLKVLTEEITID